jgi:CDP-glycerol glycerophosphotransferase (TagB/SpsB family)
MIFLNLKTLFYLFLSPFFLIAFFLSNFFPKKNIWLISEWFGKTYKDNGKVFYEHLIKKKIEVYWLTRNKKLLAQHPKFVYLFSIKSLYLHLISSVFIISHSSRTEFIPYLISAKSKIIHLYHGVPIKFVESDSIYSKSNGLFFKIISSLLPFLKKRFDLLIALNQENKKHLKSAFRCKEDKIKITGFPRYDRLFASIRSNKNKSSEKRQGQRILYQPTFQGQPGDCFIFYNKNNKISITDFIKIIQNQNIFIDIKLHPASKIKSSDLYSIDKNKKIRIISSDLTLESIGHDYDYFMTDFSGSYFDFLPFNKPIIINLTGLDDYLKNSREGFYYDITDLSNYTFDNWEELDLKIKNIRDNNHYHLNKYHQFQDSSSCKRVYDEIIKLLEL